MKFKRWMSVLLAALLLIPTATAQEQKPIRIAVIDTGISTTAISGKNLAEGKNYAIPEHATEDAEGHGTAVASIIVGSESAGVESLCPEAVLVPLVYRDTDDTGKLVIEDLAVIAQMIRDAVDLYDCDIINLSSAFMGQSIKLRDAVKYAKEQGVLLVCSAGNSGSDRTYYPAGYEDSFCIGTQNEQGDGKAAFSNYNSAVDMIAPGVAIPAAATDGSLTTVDGTSFSTAYISGFAARLMTEHPELTAGQVEQILLASARDLGTAGRDDETGWGALDEETAFAYAETGRMFRDVTSGDWFFAEVNTAVRTGILKGTDTVSFTPRQATTRAMLWVMLHRAEGLPVSKNPESWYSDARDWVVAVGISDGLNPDNSITREEMATMLWRYAKHKGMDVSTADEEKFAGFSDTAQVSVWAAEPMKWACSAGIINGSGGALLPGNTADRAQTAVILVRFLAK